jgi:hypothetical protein
MNTTSFRNIHVAAAGETAAATVETTALPRLRLVTNDPAREYAQRAGEVERLPDSVAALILSKQGFSKVTRNGVIVEGVGPKPLRFWSEHSITVTEKAGTNDKVLWTLNRQQPDVLHILTPDGEYVESIPLAERPAWFDDAAMHRTLGAVTRSQNRKIERVRKLHGIDTEKALEAACENEHTFGRLVHTFPASGAHAPAPDRAETNFPHDRTPGESSGERIDPEQPIVRDSSFTRAERLHQIQQHLDESRNAHTSHEKEEERRERSAARFAQVCRLSENQNARPAEDNSQPNEENVETW